MSVINDFQEVSIRKVGSSLICVISLYLFLNLPITFCGLAFGLPTLIITRAKRRQIIVKRQTGAKPLLWAGFLPSYFIKILLNLKLSESLIFTVGSALLYRSLNYLGGKIDFSNVALSCNVPFTILMLLLLVAAIRVLLVC